MIYVAYSGTVVADIGIVAADAVAANGVFLAAAKVPPATLYDRAILYYAPTADAFLPTRIHRD